MNPANDKKRSFGEGDREFLFSSEHWAVRKYDLHRFYKGFSAHGLKGVDYIGIFEKTTLVLLEVKDFRLTGLPARDRQVIAALQEPKKLAENLFVKVQDTKRGLNSIGKYYEERWIWRGVAPFIPGRNLQQQDWWFWLEAKRIMEQSGNLKILLALDHLPEQKEKMDVLKSVIGQFLPEASIIKPEDLEKQWRIKASDLNKNS